MSETLDWMFELDGDTSGADRLLKTLDHADKTMSGLNLKTHDLEKATRAAGEGHKAHAHEAEGLAGALHHVSHGFGEMLETVGEWKIAEWGIEKVKELLIDLPREMFKGAAAAERTAKAFDLMFGAEGGKENLEYIEQIGKFTEFTQEHIKSAVLGLGKVGFQGEGLDRALAAAHDMAAFSANPEEGFGEAISSLSRIKRTGRVDNRVLGGLGIGQKDFFAELAERTGKSAKVLKKEMDKGTLDAEDSIETLYSMIAKKTGKDLGGAAVDMSKSMTAMLTHAQELPDRYFERLKDTPGFGAFKDAVGHVLEGLDPDSPAGRRIFGALEEAFSSAGEFLKGVDLEGDIKGALDVLHEIADVVSKIILGFETMGHAVNDYVVKPIATIDNLVRNNRASKAIQGSDWIHKYTPIGFLQDKLGSKAADAGASVPEGLARGMMSGGGEVNEAGMSLGYDAEAGARGALESHSPSKLFEDIGMDTAEGFSRGVEAGSNRMGAAIADLVPSIGAPRAGAGGGVQVSITIPVALGSHGGDTAAQVEDFRARLRAILPAELISAFEQLGIEGGG